MYQPARTRDSDRRAHPRLAGGAGVLSAGRPVPAAGHALAWGLATGLGLVAWAYEPFEVRRWGERLMLAGVILYLVVGVLIAENLPRWLDLFPPRLSSWLTICLLSLHEDNPFGVIRHAMTAGPDVSLAGWIASRPPWDSSSPPSMRPRRAATAAALSRTALPPRDPERPPPSGRPWARGR